MSSSYTIIGRPDFLKGGKAFFTVSNNKGEHYTFRISSPKPKNDNDTPPLFASVLKGPDNYSNYKYIGIYDPARMTVRCTKASKYREGSTEYKVLLWAVGVIHEAYDCPAGYEMRHAGKCCVCGRKLTTPESIEAGIGPECAKKGLL